MDNRSEPRGWLADGSPDGTDPQDAEQAATVRTALSTPEAGSADFSADTAFSADPGFGAETGYSDAGYTAAPGTAEPPGSHAGGSSYGYGNGTSSSANSGSSSATVPPSSSWPAGTEAPPPPAATGAAGSPGSYSASGTGAAMGYDAYGTSAPAAQSPARSAAGGAAFPASPGARPKGGRAGKSAGSARPAAAQRPAAGVASAVNTRRAQLTVSRIEPWSVMKFSFMISLVGWVILFIAVSILYFLLSKLGVFNSIENTVGLVTAGKNHAGTDASSWFSASRVLGYTMLAGAVNVILITALATVGSVLYNLVTLLAGGIEVTLKETE